MKIVNISELISKIIYSNLGQKEINTFSNELEVENITHSFSKVKTSARTFAMPNEDVEQTVTLKNNSDLSFIDPLPSSVTFIENNVKFDNVLQPGLNPIFGFALPKLLEKSEIKLSYEIMVNWYDKINKYASLCLFNKQSKN